MENAHVECFAQVLQCLREPFLVASRDGLILAANVAGAEALSTEIAELVGASVTAFSPAPSGLIERLRANPGERAFPLRGKDGRRFMCDATLLAPNVLVLRLSGGPDAEPRARVFREELLSLDGMTALSKRAASRLELLNAFSGALAKVITPPDVVETIVEMGMAATSARSGGLWLLSPDGKIACLARGVGPTGPRAEDYAQVPLDQELRMPILDAMRDGAPVWIESCTELERRYPMVFRAFSKGGESSLACVPLFSRGRCIGGLALNYDGAHQFLEDERAFLQLLAQHSAQAVERARLYAAEKRARQEAEASQRRSAFLARASMLLASSLDYSATLAAIADAAVPTFADWCIVELEEERLRGVEPVAAHVDRAKVPFVLELSRRFRRLDDGQRGIAEVIRTGKSKFYPSITVEQIRETLKDTPEFAELYATTGAVSTLVVPISARGRTPPNARTDRMPCSLTKSFAGMKGLCAASSTRKLLQPMRSSSWKAASSRSMKDERGTPNCRKTSAIMGMRMTKFSSGRGMA